MSNARQPLTLLTLPTKGAFVTYHRELYLHVVGRHWQPLEWSNRTNESYEALTNIRAGNTASRILSELVGHGRLVAVVRGVPGARQLSRVGRVAHVHEREEPLLVRQAGRHAGAICGPLVLEAFVCGLHAVDRCTYVAERAGRYVGGRREGATNVIVTNGCRE